MRARIVAIAGLIAGPIACQSPAPTPAPVATTEAAPIAPVELVELHPNGATNDSPLIVALHGLGDTPENFAHAFDGFPGTAEIAVARGTLTYDRGFSWYEWSPGLTPDQLAAQIRAVDRAIWPAIVQHAHGRPIVVTGFSQGAILSYAFAALHPTEVKLAVPIAGRLPAPLWPAKPAAPVEAFHGTDDPRISIGDARATIAAFRAAGGPTELHAYPRVRHEIGEMRDDIFAALARAIR